MMMKAKSTYITKIEKLKTQAGQDRFANRWRQSKFIYKMIHIHEGTQQG
jgi:hypothetical protein